MAVRTNMKKEGKLTKKALQRQQEATERQARKRQKKRDAGDPIEELSKVYARKTKDQNKKRQRGDPANRRYIESIREDDKGSN